MFAETLHGRGAVMVVNAPVGAGKTALLRAMTDRAARQGGACFSVTASAGERPYPLGLMDRLVRSLRAAGMDDPFPGGELDGRRRQEWTRSDFFVVMERAFGVLRDFAESRRVVIGIDDVHFADDQSLRCLAYLIRRIEWSGVLMVLNESSSHERELAALHAEMLHLASCHRVRLAPLTVSGVAGQLSDRLGTPPARETIQFCAEASGGNPLLLHALIDDLPAGTGEPAEPRASFQQAVLRSLHRSQPGTVAVARSLAVLGSSAAPGLIAEFLGVDVAQVREAILELRAMGLLAAGPRPARPGPGQTAHGGQAGYGAPAVFGAQAGLGHSAAPTSAAGEFRHDHTRLAVLAGIPLADLPEMHSKAAELLHERGAPAIAVADQLMAARDSDKAAWRVAILCEAAREAMASGDVAGAVIRLRYAVALSADEAQRARVGVLLADAEWHVDPSKAARRLPDLGQDARAGLLTGRDALVLVNQLLWWGEFAEADALLRGAGLEGEGDTSLARLWAVFCRAGIAGEGPGGAAGHPPGAGWAWSGPMVAVTYLGSAASLAYDGTQAAGADQILRGIRAGLSLTPALHALVLLLQTGRLDEAVRWSGRLLEEDWIRHVPMRRVMIETVRSVAALRRGDSAEALRFIRAVLDAVPPATWGVVVGLPLSLAVRATTELGDFQAARSYLNHPVPSAMFDTPFALPYLQALGRYHLAMGYPQTALTHFQSCVELMAMWRVDAADVVDAAGWRNEAAAALRAMGMIRPMRAFSDEPREISKEPGTEEQTTVQQPSLEERMSGRQHKPAVTRRSMNLAPPSSGHEGTGRRSGSVPPSARGRRLRPGGVDRAPGQAGSEADTPAEQGETYGPAARGGVADPAARGGAADPAGRGGVADPRARGGAAGPPVSRAPDNPAAPGGVADWPAPDGVDRAIPGGVDPAIPGGVDPAIPGGAAPAIPGGVDDPTVPGGPAASGADGPAADPADPAEPASAGLTYAERRVASLAATGNTNRQIAEKLFITVSTVEQHLTKIYRKLNVQSRSGLSAALRRYRR